MSLHQEFLGVTQGLSTEFRVHFSDAVNQAGPAVQTAINGVEMNNGMDGQTHDVGYDPAAFT